MPSRVLMQHPTSAVNAKCQRGKQGKHIRQLLLGSPARLRMDLFTSAAFRLNLCKFDHPTEIRGSINKQVFENILKCQ